MEAIICSDILAAINEGQWAFTHSCFWR